MTRECIGHGTKVCAADISHLYHNAKRCDDCRVENEAALRRVYARRRLAKEKTHGPDCCTEEGANRLREMIEAYWRDRGGDVTVKFRRAGFVPIMRSARIDIRSNMVNGLPANNLEGNTI